jgi:hypothetical protein
MTDQQGRYVCYGTVAKEHDETNADLAASDQRPPEEVVYSTDDREEALAIKRNGGFVGEDGQWTVAARVVDSQAEPAQSAARDKRDFSS